MIHSILAKGVRRGAVAALAASTIACATAAGAAQDLRLSTLGPGTSPYIVMNTFANIVNAEVEDYDIQVNATGAATRHAVQTARGDTHFFMSSPNLYHMMATETGPYEGMQGVGRLAENLRTVFNFPMGFYHAVTFADSGIESYDDIKGKRVFLGPPGGAAQQSTSLLIEAITGYQRDEDYEVVSLGWDAAAQSFQDGHIDVYFNPTLPPSPVIEQIAMTNDIRLLGIPQEMGTAEALGPAVARAGFRLGEIPAGSYGEGQVAAGDILTLAVTVGVVTNADMPEEAIYEMTRAFWENIDARAENLPLLQNITLERALIDINTPLHPGAQRYYEERGLEIPEAAKAE
ncbi:TAXI family TRAP transporter solute-binding subunit [Aquisalimonas lutea]|uniref:TAXI family TRAP transporter solute-binding subunit n=1 Tax=Aquisalimonas lutea TaxID=1327750 RepID=UPI0025B4D5AD|nr:TAXI family TRAP transporter solute-binding subunit [Aquisalimonas lutea]MDN3518235.1 TAXI family TRAP transporter solute-binding subunit [Aquisalimonas lutea]